MNTTQTHDPPPDATTKAYLPPDGVPSRRAIELVARSSPVGESELVPLLRTRLRFLLVIFAVFYTLVFLLVLSYLPFAELIRRADPWVGVVTLVTCFGLAAILSSRLGLTLRQLRGIEFLMVALFVARMLLRGYSLFWWADYLDRVHAWIAAGDDANAREMLNGLAHRLILPSAMFVVTYGVIVPNTWRRCALVVAAFTALTIAEWLVACVARDLPIDYWFPLPTTISFMVLILLAVLSVYGSYRIESSRQEAAEARRLGQYVLRGKIGGGGMGEVYLADHVLLRRPCAIKLIHPARAGDPAMLQRFEREVRATATLTHPNAVQVFDYGHTPDGTFYYVMEYLPGPTLEEMVGRHGPLPPERALHFLRQLCGALREAHAIGLIHRDLKPGNVIVCDRGRVPDVVKLLDFGLVHSASASADDDRLTKIGTVLGTPAFLSPEQAGGEAVDARSDIYSLGAVAYFLITGKPPFAGLPPAKMIAAHLYEHPTPPSALNPGVPADLEAVVLKCLAKASAGRFLDVEELDAALAACHTREPWTAARAAAWWRAEPPPAPGLDGAATRTMPGAPT
jgi:serine/threonine-protein kinase